MSQISALAPIPLIYDRGNGEPSRELIEGIGVVPVSIDAGALGRLSQSPAVLVDVDLRNLANVQHITSLLAQFGGVRLFAVEGGDRAYAGYVQANALGARKVLRRPLRSDAIREALAELGVHVNFRPPLDEAPGGASIRAAAQLLEVAFQSLSAGTPINDAHALEAGQQLLLGVNDVGLEPWLDTVRAYHHGTFQHCLLVAGAAAANGSQIALPGPDQINLTIAALLHDIGKAEVPLEILDKPGKLTDAEYAIVKRHPRIGRDYLAQQSSVGPTVLDAVLHHHEYLDGSGYPDGLAGNEIDPLTRVLTVCDVYAALVERRSYKDPKSPREAIAILTDMAWRGKVEYAPVRGLAQALGISMVKQHSFG